MSEKVNEKDLKKQSQIKKFEETKTEMIKRGYVESLGTISVSKANLYALLTAGPIAIICCIIYFLKWKSIYFHFTSITLILYFSGIFVSVIVHELIHGFTWSLFCKNKLKSISFGIMWSSFTPYCHCEEPLDFKSYLIGCIAPLFILGILSFIISLIIGNPLILILSLINILSAGEDTTICLLLFKFKDALFIDHPTDCGFVAFTK